MRGMLAWIGGRHRCQLRGQMLVDEKGMNVQESEGSEDGSGEEDEEEKRQNINEEECEFVRI